MFFSLHFASVFPPCFVAPVFSQQSVPKFVQSGWCLPQFFAYLNYVLYAMFVVAVLVKGRLEVPAYVILLSWLLLTVQSYMEPLVFSRVLAMTASLSQQSFSIRKDCFFYQALVFLGFFFS